MPPVLRNTLCSFLLAGALAFALAPAAPLSAETPTPPPPAHEEYLTVAGERQLVVEWRWTVGELMVFYAVVAFTALYGLRWLYDLARAQQRE